MLAGLQARLNSVSRPVLTLGIGIIVVLAIFTVLVVTGSVSAIPAAIFSAAIPVSLGLVGQFVSSDRQNKREIEAKLRERKSEVYEGFIKFWMDNLMLKENRDKLQKSPNQLAKGVNDFSKAMMLWASNDVVQSYADYRREINQGSNGSGKPGIASMIHFEEMLFLMREDLGHDRAGFRRYDLLSFFINDLHRYDKDGNLIDQPALEGE